MATAVALVLQGLSLLIQWLSYRKQKKVNLSDRDKRVLGHLASKMQDFIQLAASSGVTPARDDEAVISSL